MKIVSILAANDEPEIVDANLAFHLGAGVDLVVAAAGGALDETREVIDSYAHMGQVETVSLDVEEHAGWRTAEARRAVAEHGADWVLSSDADEFWWPRGESLKDVLAAIPPRYRVVQGLVRVFPPSGSETEFFAERMTMRLSLLRPEDTSQPLPWALRSLYRADKRLAVDPEEGIDHSPRVPLRAWYPIEVLRFPLRSLEQTERRCALGVTPRSTIEADALDAYRHGRLGEWYTERATRGAHLVEDERLRNALHELRRSDRTSLRRQFVLPPEPGDPLVLGTPDIVDDASYAVECAAVGEVDLERLDRHIRELEERIGVLEARFWPRVARTLSRAVRR